MKMPPVRADIDALFVINQDTPLTVIKDIVAQQGFGKVLILSSHQLLENEQQDLKLAVPDISFLTFSDLLSDAALAACDEAANISLENRRSPVHASPDFMARFIDRSLWYKNRAAHRALLNRFSPDCIYAGRHLGIHHRFWCTVGARPVGHSMAGTLRHALATFIRRCRQLWRKKTVIQLEDDSHVYLIFSGVERLPLAPDARPTTTTLSRQAGLLLRLRPGTVRSALPLLNHGHAGDKKPVIVATTIHGYQPHLHRLTDNLHVFVDGYHPSNYPRSYIDNYGNCTFVPDEMFGDQWFRRHGKRTIKPPAFIARPTLPNSCDTNLDTITSVVLVLNHAGDWTALINRSDTDRLMAAFCDAADRFPALTVIIRPHPTMAMRAHEGIDSLKRIQAYVVWHRKANLEVSSVSLEEDLDRGQLFISQYSNVLLTVYRLGLPGLIVNVTDRRSFMHDYENLGFPAARSGREMESKIRAFVSDPEDFCRQQTRAAVRFNRLLEQWETSGKHHHGSPP